MPGPCGKRRMTDARGRWRGRPPNEPLKGSVVPHRVYSATATGNARDPFVDFGRSRPTIKRKGWSPDGGAAPGHSGSSGGVAVVGITPRANPYRMAGVNPW